MPASFYLFLPLLPPSWCWHTINVLSSTQHTYRNAPDSYRIWVRYWARERGGREEMREGEEEHRDISQVWQWSRISSPRHPLWTLIWILSAPTAEPEDRLPLQSMKRQSRPEDLIQCRVGLRALISSRSDLDAAWRSVQIKNPPQDQVRPTQTLQKEGKRALRCYLRGCSVFLWRWPSSTCCSYYSVTLWWCAAAPVPQLDPDTINWIMGCTEHWSTLSEKEGEPFHFLQLVFIGEPLLLDIFLEPFQEALHTT